MSDTSSTPVTTATSVDGQNPGNPEHSPTSPGNGSDMGALALKIVGILLLLGLVIPQPGTQAFEDHAVKARELERKLLMKDVPLDYADPGYLGVAKELAQVPFWSSEYANAQSKLEKIQAARRLKLNETHALPYLPASLQGVSLASLAPERLDRDRPKTRPAPPPPAAPVAPPIAPVDVPTAIAPPAPASVAGKTAQSSVTQGPVILYTTTWCGYCKRARAYFNQKGIPYIEKDVERDPVAGREAMMKSGGSGGVPVIDIDGTIIQGFDVMGIERALAQRTTPSGKTSKKG